jgi:putative peptidoglycan lipid II flippase
MAAFWSLWVNLAASLLLMGPMLHAGLALATAVSSAFNLGYLLWKLRAATGHDRLTARELCLGRVLVATGGMLLPVWWGMSRSSWHVSGIAEAVLLAGLVCGGAAAYLACARALGLAEAKQVISVLRRRGGRG